MCYAIMMTIKYVIIVEYTIFTMKQQRNFMAIRESSHVAHVMYNIAYIFYGICVYLR